MGSSKSGSRGRLLTEKEKQKNRDRARQYYHNNKAKVKKYKRKNKDLISKQGRRYTLKRRGLTPVKYNTMLDLQGHVCTVCKQPPYNRSDVLCVDHCHATGENRELLCRSCNWGIGKLKDDPNLCLAAAVYLTKWRKIHDDNSRTKGDILEPSI